jgi:hypothetical protein
VVLPAPDRPPACTRRVACWAAPRTYRVGKVPANGAINGKARTTGRSYSIHATPTMAALRSPGDGCGAGHAPAQPTPPTRLALEVRPCRTTAPLTPNREAETRRPLRSTGRSAGGCGRTPRDLCSLDWRPWAGPPGRGPRMTLPGSPLSRGAPEACVVFADSSGAGALLPDGHPTHSLVGFVHVLSISRTALARCAILCYDRLSSCGGHVSRRRTGFCAQM